MGVVFHRAPAQQKEARNACRLALALAGTPSPAKDLGILAIRHTPAARGRPHHGLDIVRQLGGQEDLVLWSDSDDGAKPLVHTWKPGPWLRILERAAGASLGGAADTVLT